MGKRCNVVSQLEGLEGECIQTIREVAAEFSRPVMLCSMSQDSSVPLRLAQKAFAPRRLPFPLQHVDTSNKFREVIEFRDTTSARQGVDKMILAVDEWLAGRI